MLMRFMLFIVLAAGCDANLKVATSGALINCVTTPNDPSCHPTIEDFKAEKAELDGNCERCQA